MNLTSTNLIGCCLLIFVTAPSLLAQSGTRGGGPVIIRGGSSLRTPASQQRPLTAVAPVNPLPSVPQASPVTARGFALIEMFTSSECPKCKRAEGSLTWINSAAARGNYPVYTLSFHHMKADSQRGRDVFAKDFATRRFVRYQSLAMPEFGSLQVMINGERPVVGSKQSVAGVIKTALAGQPKFQLALQTEIGESEIGVAVSNVQLSQGQVLNIALVQNKAIQPGRTRQMHSNVVREFKVFDSEESDFSVRFAIPENFEAENFHVVAYVQSSTDTVVHGAVKMDFATS